MNARDIIWKCDQNKIISNMKNNDYTNDKDKTMCHHKQHLYNIIFQWFKNQYQSFNISTNEHKELQHVRNCFQLILYIYIGNIKKFFTFKFFWYMIHLK